MKWQGSGPHSITSEQGYVIARYRVAGVEYFRPSLRGSFIGAPLRDKDDAKRACIDHHQQENSSK
jgi:hypothetical protein